MDFSIIIVSLNVKEKVLANLKALFESQGSISYEVFLVDNASSDGTSEAVAKEFPQVKLIQNQENLGFAKANNQALKLATGDNLLLFNPDMQMQADTLLNLKNWLAENKQASVVGIKLVDEKNNIVKHVRRFPKLLDQALIASKLAHFFPQALSKYLRNNFDYNKQAKVDSIRGSFFLIRRQAYKKIGMLDEQFFVWFEEVDYCLRAKKLGLEVWYTPVATSLDYVGALFAKISRSKKQVYFKESMLKYFAKWHPRYQVYILKFCWLVGDSIMFIASILKMKGRIKN